VIPRLTRAVAAGLVCQEGTGRRADPLRYWLPGQEKKWRAIPAMRSGNSSKKTNGCARGYAKCERWRFSSALLASCEGRG
jgi:hypothetical protein